MNNKAVSEVVGYIFVLGIVLSAVAYAYISVANLIKDTSDRYRVEGLRESFKRIQNVFFLSTYGGSPSQSLQTELQGGYFYIDGNPHVKVTISGETILDESVGSIIFKYGDYTIAVENGAVFEDYYGCKKTVVDPRIFIKQVEVEEVSGAKGNVTMAVFYIVRGDISVSGYGPVQLIFDSKVQRSYFSDSNGTMTISITSKFSERWWDYFKNRMGFETSPVEPPSSGQPVIASIDFDKAVVTVYAVNVSYRLLS